MYLALKLSPNYLCFFFECLLYFCLSVNVLLDDDGSSLSDVVCDFFLLLDEVFLFNFDEDLFRRLGEGDDDELDLRLLESINHLLL